LTLFSVVRYVLRNNREVEVSTPKRKKKTAVADRVYSDFRFNDVRTVIDGVQQIDITTLTLFCDHREDEIYKLKEEKNGGNGHVFWTEDEKRIFQLRFYSSFMKTGKKISMSLVKGYCKQLSDEFPAYKQSFSQKKIVNSVYYCVNNMSKKRAFIYPIKMTLEYIYFRAYATMDIIMRNRKDLVLRKKLYYSSSK
jgi:hypothetical protein